MAGKGCPAYMYFVNSGVVGGWNALNLIKV